MKNITQLETNIQLVLQELETLSDEELKAGLNFPIRLDDNFLPEVQRDHSLRQKLAREILAIHQGPPIAHRPRCPDAVDLGAYQPVWTIRP